MAAEREVSPKSSRIVQLSDGDTHRRATCWTPTIELHPPLMAGPLFERSTGVSGPLFASLPRKLGADQEHLLLLRFLSGQWGPSLAAGLQTPRQIIVGRRLIEAQLDKSAPSRRPVAGWTIKPLGGPQAVAIARGGRHLHGPELGQTLKFEQLKAKNLIYVLAKRRPIRRHSLASSRRRPAR